MLAATSVISLDLTLNADLLEPTALVKLIATVPMSGLDKTTIGGLTGAALILIVKIFDAV